jgi:hypothetical protein
MALLPIWAAWWMALAAVWLLLVGSFDRDELIALVKRLSLLGVAAYAGWARHATAAAAGWFVDTVSYQHRVLGGSARPHTLTPQLHLALTGIALDLVAVGVAVILARARSRQAARPGRAVMAAKLGASARRAHDGSVSDSATWATIGTATIAVILAVAAR